MVLWHFGAEIAKYVRMISNSYIAADDLPSQESYRSQNDLRLTLSSTMSTPLKIEYYLWIWTLFSFYAVLKMIVLLPFELLVGIFNSLLSILHIAFSTYTTFFSVVTLIATYIFQQEQFAIFDPSYMYHMFRGQASLKLYGLMFAIQIGEKIFTMVGKYLYTSMKEKLEDPANVQGFIHLVPEMIVTLLYTCAHTFVIYLEFNIYIVVMNTSVPNFIIFIFVINLTKMKSVAMKKSDPKAYQSQINLDAKERLQKTLYLILFQLSQSNRSINNIHFKLFFIFGVGALIEHVKHMTVLRLSPQIGDINKICNRTFYNLYLSTDYRTFVKCLQNDFTVIPFTVFFLKMIQVILSSGEELTQVTNEEALNTYLYLCVLTLIIKTLMIIIQIVNVLDYREEALEDEPKEGKDGKQGKQVKYPPRDTKIKKSASLDYSKSEILAAKDIQGSEKKKQERAKSVKNIR